MNLEDLIVKALVEAKDSEESIAERMDGQENISYIAVASSVLAGMLTQALFD